MKNKIAIVGAGFSGAVIANQLAHAGYTVEVFDARPHVAGNCHSERDVETGVMVHVYEPHISHTHNERAWEFVNRFSTFKPFVNRVKAITKGQVFTLPINLLTFNQFFGKTLRPAEAQAFLASLGDKSIENPPRSKSRRGASWAGSCTRHSSRPIPSSSGGSIRANCRPVS